MIDITNPTLTDALYIGLGMGTMFGIMIGMVLAYVLLLWCGKM